VRLAALQSEKRDLASRTKRATDVPLRGRRIRVVHASIIGTHDDERLSARDGGRPLDLSLDEANVAGSTERRGSEHDSEAESDP
jgi:hypothetical protein